MIDARTAARARKDFKESDRIRDELAAMNIGAWQRVATLLWDARFSLVTALLAGFGRAAAEVGAVGPVREAATMNSRSWRKSVVSSKEYIYTRCNMVSTTLA